MSNYAPPPILTANLGIIVGPGGGGIENGTNRNADHTFLLEFYAHTHPHHIPI